MRVHVPRGLEPRRGRGDAGRYSIVSTHQKMRPVAEQAIPIGM